MAKFFCAYSGIECEVSYLPLFLHSREYAHPVFFLPQKKLLGLYAKYQQQALGDVESYLLYLALFNSTDLIEFRVPAAYTKNTPKIIAHNMELLCEVIFKINAVCAPSVQFPRFVISAETKTLENSQHWIEAWLHNYNDFLDGNRKRIAYEELEKIESRLHRLILDPNTNPSKYANVLATWAMKAGEFPTDKRKTDFGVIETSEYWQLIIRKCVNEKAIFDIPSSDINELVTFCEENIEHGTMYAHSLMKLLREGKEKQVNYLGLGDLNIPQMSYQILDEETSSVEAANMIAILNSAPATEPKRTEYPTEFLFQKAKIKWQMAQRIAAARASAPSTPSTHSQDCIDL